MPAGAPWQNKLHSPGATNMIESPAHILPVAAESYSDKVALVTEDAQLGVMITYCVPT